MPIRDPDPRVDERVTRGAEEAEEDDVETAAAAGGGEAGRLGGEVGGC